MKKNPLVQFSSKSSHSLPVELLSLIFLECCSTDLGYLGCPKLSRMTAPLNLTWVCSYWRQVALSLPQLWTDISLNPSNYVPSSADAQLLELCLSRSGNVLPLSLVLEYGTHSSPFPIFDKASTPEYKVYCRGMRRLAQILDRVRSRWRVLAVRSLVIGALDDFLHSIALGAPMLESFLISTKYFDLNGNYRTLDLARCPQLQTSTLICPDLILDLYLPDVSPLQSMSTLNIGYCQFQADAFAWLQSCPNLEKLSIQFFSAPPSALPHARPVTLSRLADLSIMCLLDTDPGPFLQLLILPRLRNFSFSTNGFVDTGAGGHWRHAIELLQRSGGAPLRGLELLETPMKPQELLLMLQLTPDLENLTIDDTLATDDVLEQLSAIGTGVPLCPKLETLELHTYLRSPNALAAMVSSRFFCSVDTASLESGDSRLSYDMPTYRTLKTLILVGSIISPLLDHPVFRDCHGRGLKIVQSC
ncbi:hypothetical protein DFH11DRAFT_540017 [Phellopilus nigrolimitatus]|nr:hypothetical protein DFH11DRAFT_540017 [Phellopilus nigrolimitatus]